MAEHFFLTAVTPSGTIEQWDEITADAYAVIVDILGPPVIAKYRPPTNWPERPIDRDD